MRIRQRDSRLFSIPHLDRRSEARRAPGWPDAVLADPSARFIASLGSAHLVQAGPAAAIRFLDATHPWVRQAAVADLTLLGWYQDAPCVALQLPAPLTPPPDAKFEQLRPLLPLLTAEDSGLLSYVRALLLWRTRHRHCGVCGAPMQPRNAGHSLACTRSGCGEEYFPRIDPAVIVLVTHRRQALLGRQASWPAGRYSALSGFVEAGESLEDAVVREVHEETGVSVSAVRYFASQPWPFPASLMLGFHARAALRRPVRLDGELEDARWFSVEELRAAPPALLPQPHTIARRLVDAWLDHLHRTG